MVAPINEVTGFEKDDFFGLQISNEHAIFPI
jgi:hypothetical protein